MTVGSGGAGCFVVSGVARVTLFPLVFVGSGGG